MTNSDIYSFLRLSKSVYSISFVSYNGDKETTEIRLTLYTERIHAFKDGMGNTVVISSNFPLMEDIYHLCLLCNYDVDFNRCSDFGILHFIASNGPSKYFGGKTLFARINNINPDKLFTKDEDNI